VVKPVVLLSDFGTADHYVGVLHAVLVGEAPGLVRIDLGHDIPPGDVWTGCFLLQCAWSQLPADAVVLGVVDPGVGGSRRSVAARVGGRWIVARDNGLAAAAGPVEEAVELDWRTMGLDEPSRTFHGRDLFAPAAARLALGAEPALLGKKVDLDSLQPSPVPPARRGENGWQAMVVHVDRFGNLITNLSAGQVSGKAVARFGAQREARRVGTYVEAEIGEVVVLEGSSGLLELAVPCESAEERTGLRRGDLIDITEPD